MTGRHAVWLAIFLAGASTSGAPRLSELALEMLAAHNAVRARAGVRPLAWSQRLAAAAQAWAERLISRGRFEHNLKSPYGENLLEIRGGRAGGAEVVGEWAAEAADYDYRTNACHRICGHFTQLVWRNTSEVGCAVARARDREVWVCEYRPPGNIVGLRPY